MVDYIIPSILGALALVTLARQENGYDHLLEGAQNGLRLMFRIAPSLIVLLSSVEMLRASGALSAASTVLSPILSMLGVPAEAVILMMIRPVSGSAALAIGADLIVTHGPDSLIGRTAAVMLGSTETTFYVLSIYFGSCGIKRTRYAVPAALVADITGFLTAAWTVRWLMN